MNKMWQISLFVWIICISAVNTRRNRPGRPTELNTIDLVVTAYQSLGKVHIDGEEKLAINARNWSLTDYVALSSMSRLIALEGIITTGDASCAGVLASVNGTYLLTNSSWKCSTYNAVNWTQLEFDDIGWSNAGEYGNNGEHATCTQDNHFADISSNAKWIWAKEFSALAVYCRGYLPLCLTASPCLNGGTCLPNHKKMCDCTPEYTGTYCESLLMDGSLVITAYETLVVMYIDGIEQTLVNGSRWNDTDRAGLTETNRLVAVKAKGDGTCGGILASFGDAYVLTNAEWRCSPYNDLNWYGLGFNDSKEFWFNAIEFGSNEWGHTQCSHLQYIPDISPYAVWIWDADQGEETLYCRGYMPVCDSSPCLNNGTCLKNDVRMCDCQPLFTGTYCETEIITTTRPTKPTTEMTTQSQTTEGITTSSLQTTEVTTIPQTTALQTTESATTIAATTIAATTIGATTIAATTPTITTPTTTTPTTTTPTTTTPTTTTPTTTTPTTTTPTTTTPTTTTPTTPSTIYTGLVSTTSDPPPAPICTEDLYCNGPLEKPGASIEHCACPADYLNVNNNCCMSQNWIIGLACLSAGILIIIFIIIIACLCCKDHSDHSSMGDSVELVDRDHLAADAHSMDHMTYVSETQMGDHKKPNGGIVDAHGVIAAHGVKEDALHAKADAQLATEKGTRRHSLVSGVTGVNTLRGLNPSGEHTLSQYPIYTLARRRGQPAYRSMIERGRREDFFYNPLMVELLSNDIYRHFRPSLGGIPTNVDYSIQRPEIELEFLYNELYGSDLHRGGIYDYRSPWNTDMNMRL